MNAMNFANIRTLALLCIALMVPLSLQAQSQSVPSKQAYETSYSRLKALNDAGTRVDDYGLSKAQCWVDTSFHEYTRNDRGGYPAAALHEGERLLGIMESGGKVGAETPLVNNAVKLRDDLWARFDKLHAHQGFRCAAAATACAEVRLVHAGNEIKDGGWRHSNPYVYMVEDVVARAEAAAEACPKPEEKREPIPTHFAFDADALFKFDRGDLDGLLPGGQGALDAFAVLLADHADEVKLLRVIGNTDRLGSDAYNQRLSMQRATTVRDYLASRGVKLPMDVVGMGESQPVTGSQCVGNKATAELKACLQPDRRVEIEIGK